MLNSFYKVPKLAELFQGARAKFVDIIMATIPKDQNDCINFDDVMRELETTAAACKQKAEMTQKGKGQSRGKGKGQSRGRGRGRAGGSARPTGRACSQAGWARCRQAMP